MYRRYINIFLILLSCSLIQSAHGQDEKKVSFVVNGVYRIPQVIYGYDSVQIRPSSLDSLNYVVKLLNTYPNLKVEIGVHDSLQEGIKHSFPLSQARAQQCVNYLISKGIDSARLVAHGWGSSIPLPGCTPADISKMKTQKEKTTAKNANRRTELRVLSLDYKAK